MIMERVMSGQWIQGWRWYKIAIQYLDVDKGLVVRVIDCIAVRESDARLRVLQTFPYAATVKFVVLQGPASDYYSGIEVEPPEEEPEDGLTPG